MFTRTYNYIRSLVCDKWTDFLLPFLTKKKEREKVFSVGNCKFYYFIINPSQSDYL